MAGPNLAWRGMAWQGRQGRDRRGVARRGLARLGMAKLGRAGQNMAGMAKHKHNSYIMQTSKGEIIMTTINLKPINKQIIEVRIESISPMIQH